MTVTTTTNRLHSCLRTPKPKEFLLFTNWSHFRANAVCSQNFMSLRRRARVDITPHILYLGPECTCAVNLMPRPLLPVLTEWGDGWLSTGQGTANSRKTSCIGWQPNHVSLNVFTTVTELHRTPGHIVQNCEGRSEL